MKFERIFTGGVSKLVQEGLEDESKGIIPRRAQRARRHSQRYERHAVVEIVDELCRELAGIHSRRSSNPVAGSKGHEMIAERDQLAVLVETALEEVEARRSIEIVLDVVLPTPEQLYRRADGLRDPGGLNHIVVKQAPAEAASDPRHADRDIALGHAQG